MAKDIYRVNSDSNVAGAITEALRNRELGQKYIYMKNGPEAYYDYSDSFWQSIDIGVKDIENVLKETFLDFKKNGGRTTVVSLGCGNSEKETFLLNKYFFEGLKYIGLDFSEGMLRLSQKKLEQFKGDYTLVRSDLGDVSGSKYVNELTSGEDNRLFLLLGNTFGNIKPTNIADILNTHLNKGDRLLLDLTIKDDTVKRSVELFNHYKDKTNNNKQWREILLHGLHNVGFPIEKGKVIIETEEDNKIGCYKIKFGLEMLENVEFELEGDVILSKGEKIIVFELYYYIPNKFVEFMRLHHFKLINKSFKEFHGQFLFEKE